MLVVLHLICKCSDLPGNLDYLRYLDKIRPVQGSIAIDYLRYLGRQSYFGDRDKVCCILIFSPNDTHKHTEKECYLPRVLCTTYLT